MIVCGIFTIAGLIAFQNTSGPENNYDGEDTETGLYFLFALVCWLIAGLAGAGVIS